MLVPEQAYGLLPPALQNVVCSVYGLRERHKRMGPAFHDYYYELLESESASNDHIQEYQAEQVTRLVRHAYDTVPYYRRVMEERGLQPRDVSSVADLSKLPILTKEDVIANFSDMRSSSYPVKSLQQRSTGGTTGTALRFLTTREAVAFQWAVWWRHRARFGAYPSMWHLNFTIRPVIPASRNRPPYWRWNVPMRQALVNAHKLSAEQAGVLADFIDSQDFPFFVGYPSTIATFAEALEQQGRQLVSHPRHIFLGAEATQDSQRASIERVTSAKVSDQYGFSEGCGNASRCECDNYHEDWEFGVLECREQEVSPDGSRRGAVLATGFSNHGFPFIRYEVGDSALWAPPAYRCACGRASSVLLRIEGRSEDYVITPEGSRVMRFGHLFKDTPGIREAQVVQEELGSITVRFVPRPTFSRTDEEHVRGQVRDWISPSLVVNFERVDEIPRSASGKFRPVLSLLDKSGSRGVENTDGLERQ